MGLMSTALEAVSMDSTSAIAINQKTAKVVSEDGFIVTGNFNEQVDVLSEIDAGQLKPGKYQPRTRMDETSLKELAGSINSPGDITPILVRPLTDGSHEIIAGERRWRAAQMAGLNQVPVLVRKVPDSNALATALIENIMREDLNPLEEAECIKRLIDECYMSHQMAAATVGRSSSSASNLLKLLNLTPPVKTMLMNGDLEIGHARALLQLEGAGQVAEAKRTVGHGLSVRVTELNIQHSLTHA